MKTVKTLKKKHRNALWLDDGGDVWFYNLGEKSWQFLGGFEHSDNGPAGVEYVMSANPSAVHGPFDRLLEFDR